MPPRRAAAIVFTGKYSGHLPPEVVSCGSSPTFGLARPALLHDRRVRYRSGLPRVSLMHLA